MLKLSLFPKVPCFLHDPPHVYQGSSKKSTKKSNHKQSVVRLESFNHYLTNKLNNVLTERKPDIFGGTHSESSDLTIQRSIKHEKKK